MVPGQTASRQTPAPTPPAATPQSGSQTGNTPASSGQPAQPGTTPATPKAQSITVLQVVEKPTRETTVGDILLGSVGFVGFVLLAALVVGLLAGSLFILVKRMLPDNTFNGQTAEEAALKLNALSDSPPERAPAKRA
jgi:hypothetical protein